MLATLTLICLFWLGGPALQPRDGWTLTADDGRVVSDRDFRGRYLLIYFGYTACPDICPTTLGAMEAALRSLGDRRGRLRAVFVTVDPAHDTPAVLRRYLAGFGGDLVGLTGTPARIAAMERRYDVAAIRHPAAGGIDHTSVLVLVGPDGRFVHAFASDQSGPTLANSVAPFLS